MSYTKVDNDAVLRLALMKLMIFVKSRLMTFCVLPSGAGVISIDSVKKDTDTWDHR